VDEPSRRTGRIIARHQSKLLAGLFRSIDPEKRLIVLEIGPALPETVEFFSRYRCRLHFLDLYSEPFLRDRDTGMSEKELRHEFEKQFDFPEGTQIDICLFGDFLSFLDDRALRAFNSALRPRIYNGTRAHGFGVHHLAVKLEHHQYGIIDSDNLSIRSRHADRMPYHPHSQVEMADMLNCFAFARGLLLPSGKLEMMLMQISDIYERDVQTSLKRLLTLAEPLIIVVIALLITVIILSVVFMILDTNDLAF